MTCRAGCGHGFHFHDCPSFRADSAEAIVATLAKTHPVANEQGWTDCCALCGAYVTRDAHNPKCPWLRAVEWVKARGARR